MLLVATSSMALAQTNYNEANVPSYTLPDPLVMDDGKPVRNVSQWEEQRRPEILFLFSQYVYGHTLGGDATAHEVIAVDTMDDSFHRWFAQQTGKRHDDSSWGAIVIWAWGLSKMLDYLEEDHDVDSKRVAVVGHSRLGKTALWAAAQDPRFAMAISNNSGEVGRPLPAGPMESA